MSHEELSFCELKAKEIVNEVDGRKLGRAIDLVFSPSNGCVLGIVAPHAKRSFFFKGQEIFIPFKNIQKIGPDVILVRLTPDLSRPDECINIKHGQDSDRSHHQPHQSHHGGHEKSHHGKDECDYKCEKCMLFDCDRRWKHNESSSFKD